MNRFLSDFQCFVSSLRCQKSIEFLEKCFSQTLFIPGKQLDLLLAGGQNNKMTWSSCAELKGSRPYRFVKKLGSFVYSRA